MWEKCFITALSILVCLTRLRAPQARGSFASEETRHSFQREEEEDQDEDEEDEPPVPMTTRLRKHVESVREREQEREQEQRMSETISVSDGEDDVGCPSQWNVEQVFSFINSLPGTAEASARKRQM